MGDYLEELRKEFPNVGIAGVGECFTELRIKKDPDDPEKTDRYVYTFLRVFLKDDITDSEAPTFSLMTSHEYKLGFSRAVLDDLDERVDFAEAEPENKENE